MCWDLTAWSTEVMTIATVAYAVTTYYIYLLGKNQFTVLKSQLDVLREQLPSVSQQSKEASRTRQVTLLPRLIDKNQQARAARIRITDAYCKNHTRFQFSSRKEMENNLPKDSQLREDCDKIIYNISEFGIFVKQGLIETNFAKDYLHIVPVRMWLILEQYILIGEGGRGYSYFGHPLRLLTVLGITYWVWHIDNLQEASESPEFIIPHSEGEIFGNHQKKSKENLITIKKTLLDELVDSGWLPGDFPV